MPAIPVFVFEEHHEAFFIWHYAVMQNLMPRFGNTLLHVDEHSDMGTPRFSRSIKSLNGSLQEIYDFTYSELTIENFIIPAIYQELFNKVYWIRQSREIPIPESMYVYSYDKEGKSLTAKSAKEVSAYALFNPNYKAAQFKSLTLDNEFTKNQSVVLDIDLDYFSCNHNDFNFKGELEVTEEQYHFFIQDKHQFLRLRLGSGIKAKVANGRYYLLFNDFPGNESMPNKLKVSESKIINRIERLVEFLKENQVKVQFIDICRSRLSGFTPEDQWEFIEGTLIQKLGTLFEIKVVHISDIYAQENIA